MPKAARITDKAQCSGHSCNRHPPKHTVVGPATKGASKTNINGKAALRVGDQGLHSSCSGQAQWIAYKCVTDHGVMIEGKPAFAFGDFTMHCGQSSPLGTMIEGSDDVNYGK